MTPATTRTRILAAFLLALMMMFVGALVRVAYGVDNPVITYDNRTESFLVSFPQGGFVWACTEFKSLKETIVQEDKTIPWAPRNCGGLANGERQTSYHDEFPVGPNGGEWEVRAILQTEDATEYPSNTVTVLH